MKATINELWETGRQILSFDNSEFDRPFDIPDLKQCDNVIIGNKIKGVGTEIIIDDSIYYANHIKVKSKFMDFYGIEIC